MIELATSDMTATVAVSGPLDDRERGQFPEITARVAGLRRPLLAIDLCHTEMIDAAGAAFLISLADSASRRAGAVVLRGFRPQHLVVLSASDALNLFRLDHEHRCPARVANRLDSAEL